MAETNKYSDNFVGSWRGNIPYKTEMKLCVEDGNAALYINFPDFGSYNFKPNRVDLDGDTLRWEINDEDNRGVCILKLCGDVLKGSYTQNGHPEIKAEDEIIFTRGEFSDPPPKIIPMSDKSRLELLREYADYGESASVPFEKTYILGGEMPAILGEYGLGDYVNGKSGDDVVFACLDFVCDHFYHEGSSGMNSKRTVEGVMKFAVEHKAEYAPDGDADGYVNCRGLALILASVLRFMNIKAAHVTCMPYEQPFNDCHVVVDCFLPSGSRVMLDPTYRLYLKDGDGRYVSLPHLREMLISGEEYFPNANAGYRHGKFDADDLKEQREYMTKNTFRFRLGSYFADGTDEKDARELIPKNYPADKFPLEKQNIMTADAATFWS